MSIKVGALRIERGDSALAAESFVPPRRRSNGAGGDPANAAILRPLADVYLRLGGMELTSGNPPAAMESSRKGAMVMLDLARRD